MVLVLTKVYITEPLSLDVLRRRRLSFGFSAELALGGSGCSDRFELISSLLFSSEQGRVKLLSAAGSAAVLFNGIKESWRLARKILSQFKLFWFLNVFGNTLLAIIHLEINSKKTFCCRQR